MDEETIRQDISRYFDFFERANIDRFSDIWNSSFNQRKRLLECYEYGIPFFQWNLQLDKDGNFENLLAELLTDIRNSFILACIGAYRPAITFLRSILELTLQFIYYYHHPVEYKWWRDGSHHIGFKELVEYVQKITAFKQLIKSDVTERLRKQYKDLSKFVHAEDVWHTQSQGKFDILRFNKANLGRWRTHYKRTLSLCNLLLISYFADELSDFPADARETILLNATKGVRTGFEKLRAASN